MMEGWEVCLTSSVFSLIMGRVAGHILRLLRSTASAGTLEHLLEDVEGGDRGYQK